MINSSLMDILRSLNSSELKGLNDYINSPFFNKNKNVQKLYSYICRQYPEFPADKMEKEFVFKKLFGTAKFNDGFMRTLIFLITKLAEDYLGYLNYIRSPYMSKLTLLSELYIRDVSRIMAKSLRAAETDFKRQKMRGEEHFWAMQMLEGLKNESTILKEKTLNQKEISGDLTKNILFFQSVHYFIQALNNFLFILNRRHLVDLDTDLLFMDEILGHIKENYSKYSEIPLLKLIYNQVMMNLEPLNETYYFEVKNILLKHESTLTYMEKYNASVGLQNFCMRQYNEGSSEYLREYFDLIDFFLKGSYYSPVEKGSFTPQTFKNFVIVAINLKEFEWAEKFIRVYSKKISPDSRNNTYNFSMSRVCFGKGDFEKALWYISRVSYQDLYFKLEVRYYTLMLYYELSMYSEAFDLIEAYKKFINHNKMLSGILKTKHTAFIKRVSELLKMRTSGNYRKAPQIEKELRAPGIQILNLPWLLDKISFFL